MGFFSDLKEDLSQAVNELMPEDALDAVLAEGIDTPDLSSDGQVTEEALLTEEMPDTVDSLDLSSMLDKLEEADAAMQMAEEAVALSEDTIQTAEETGGLEELLTDEVPEQEIYEAPKEPEQEVYEMPSELPQQETYEAPEVLAEEEVQMPEQETETVLPVEEEPAAEVTETDDTISEVIGEEEKTMDAQTQEQIQVEVNREAVDETAVVTEGMTITGDIMSRGSMELIGTVNGNLDIYGKLNITGTIQGDSKAAEIFAEGAKITGEVNSQGSVKIGQSSVVIGNIKAASAVIAGAVKGDIDVQGPVILDTTAIVMGNIKSKSVQINNGAVIEGLCSQCYADVNPTSFFEELKKKK